MDIQYLGHSSFLLKGKTATLVTDPFDPSMIGFKYPNVSADIVTVSHDHQDHNNISAVKDVKKVFKGVGEYEMMETSIIGLASYHDNKKGVERGKNTMYVIEMDDVRIAHLGDLGHELSEKDISALGQIDILLLPVGGHYTIGPEMAAKVMRSIEPSITVPMHFQTKGLNSDTFAQLKEVDEFISDAGVTTETMPKLSVKKDLFDEEKRVVILERK